MNKDKVVLELSNNGINTAVIGNGDVITQFYPSNAVVTNGRVILITNDSNFVIPNMMGWSKREAKYLLDYIGIRYKFNGDGYVTSQSINEGTVVEKDMEIELNFEGKVN